MTDNGYREPISPGVEMYLQRINDNPVQVLTTKAWNDWVEAFKPTMTMYEQMLLQEAIYFAQRKVATQRALEITVLMEKGEGVTDVEPNANAQTAEAMARKAAGLWSLTPQQEARGSAAEASTGIKGWRNAL